MLANYIITGRIRDEKKLAVEGRDEIVRLFGYDGIQVPKELKEFD